jgi:multiple sugar transport system substrate-binding protein
MAGGVAGAAGLAPLLGACASPGPASATATGAATAAVPRSTAATSMQMVWWGGDTRAQRTNQVIAMFQQKYPQYSIAGSFGSFGGYFDKLNTQVAAGNMPDIVQMDMRFIGGYTDKKVLLDLSAYTPDPLNLSDFDPAQLSQGRVNGGLFGVSLGGNIVGALVNDTLLDAAGAKFYAKDASYDDFADWAIKLAPALPKGVYPATDSGGVIAFEYFVRQRGRTLYTKDGKLGFTRQDAVDWLGFWDNLRKKGAAAPTSLVATARAANSAASDLISVGKAAMFFGYSNFLEGYQKFQTKSTLSLRGYPAPAKGQRGGYYVKSSQLFGVSAKTASPYQAAQFINFFINDPEAVKILQVERGVPGPAKSADIIKPLLTPVQQATVDYVNEFAKVSLAKDELDPGGAGDVDAALLRADDSIGLQGVSVSNAADTFMSEATKAVS